MKCPVCSNKMINKKIKHFQEWNDKNIIFEDVPVLECTVCNERLMDGNVVDKINSTLWNLPNTSRKENVDVYELV